MSVAGLSLGLVESSLRRGGAFDGDLVTMDSFGDGFISVASVDSRSIEIAASPFVRGRWRLKDVASSAR